MKKGSLLNADISAAISLLGHTDTLTIADAGLPIPSETSRIDLALTQGVPGFMQVLSAITAEMQVESVILAEEIKTHNPQILEAVINHLEQLQLAQGNIIGVSYVSHEYFKQQTHSSRAVIRSGECSPFANVILCAGVTF